MSAIVRVVTSWPSGEVTTEDHRWHRHSRREVLEMYRNLYEDDPSILSHRWANETLHRTRCVHGYEHHVPTQETVTFHEA